MENRFKKVTLAVVIAVGVLLIGAVVVGVLNALVADGKWTFGWNDYRYDESGYEIGDGTIPSKGVTRIALDWVEGDVELVACQDSFISLTEFSADALAESERLRWRVDENGTLSIKYRKSSWFFGLGASNSEKKLTLRIPESFFEGLTEINVETESADVVATDLFAASFVFHSSSGSLGIKNCAFLEVSADTVSGHMLTEELVSNSISLVSVRGNLDMTASLMPNHLQVSNDGGDVTLRLNEHASFRLDWATEKGSLASDLPLTREGDSYVCGGGTNTFSVTTVSGNLTIVPSGKC